MNVVNLFSKSLSDSCMSALSKGLSFVPTTQCNEFTMYIDMKKFFCVLRLREFFNSPTEAGVIQTHEDTNINPASVFSVDTDRPTWDSTPCPTSHPWTYPTVTLITAPCPPSAFSEVNLTSCCPDTEIHL